MSSASPAAGGMPVPQFQAKWRDVTLTECPASQSHFISLGRLLGVPTPTGIDPAGSLSTFERGAEKIVRVSLVNHAWRDPVTSLPTSLRTHNTVRCNLVL